jgi:hypothetical protein
MFAVSYLRNGTLDPLPENTSHRRRSPLERASPNRFQIDMYAATTRPIGVGPSYWTIFLRPEQQSGSRVRRTFFDTLAALDEPSFGEVCVKSRGVFEMHA